MTILVTGATGNIGSQVASDLVARGLDVRRLVRDPDKAQDLPGSTTAQGDYADRASLDHAMADVETAFVVSASGEPLRRAKLHGNVIDAAAAAGVKRIVYLSFQGASATSPFPYSADHLLTEAHLRQTGLDWTILRDSNYQDVLPFLADKEGVIRSPDAGAGAAWVARSDVARCAAAVLANEGYSNHRFDITGPETISLRAAVARLAALTGKAYRYESETYQAGRARLLASGASPWQAELWLGSYLAMGTGELAPVSDAVRELTGRDPLSIEKNGDAFRS